MFEGQAANVNHQIIERGIGLTLQPVQTSISHDTYHLIPLVGPSDFHQLPDGIPVEEETPHNGLTDHDNSGRTWNV